MEYLLKLHSKEDAESFLIDSFKNKKKIMGFGHRVYKNGDPRHFIIKELSRKLSNTKNGNRIMFKVSEYMEKRMVTEKKIYPNLDFFSASVYY